MEQLEGLPAADEPESKTVSEPKAPSIGVPLSSRSQVLELSPVMAGRVYPFLPVADRPKGDEWKSYKILPKGRRPQYEGDTGK